MANRREFLAAIAAAAGIPREVFADDWRHVAGRLETRFKEFDTHRQYTASRLPDNAYAAEIVSARELGQPMATIDDFLNHRSPRYGRKPDIVLSGGNFEWTKEKGYSPDALYMRNRNVQSDFRKSELYNGVLYTDAQGQLNILPTQEFRRRIQNLHTDESHPVDALQVELLRSNGNNLSSNNPTADIWNPRHFICQGNGSTYSVVILAADFTDQWVNWVANSFNAEKVIALRGGHGAQARDTIKTPSPPYFPNIQLPPVNAKEKLLINAISIYHR